MNQLPNPRKLLLILDIPKTLLLTELGGKIKYLDSRAVLENIKPDDVMTPYNVYWRTGRQEFLQNFFVKNYISFDLGVWSCLDREKTNILTKSFFGRHYRNLLFVSATNREQYEGTRPVYSAEPISIKRDLTLITQKFPQYDLNNIIVITPQQNLLNLFQYNEIVVPQFCPNTLGNTFENDMTLTGLIKYLNGLSILLNKNKIEDVRPALKGKNFNFLTKRLQFNDQQYQEYL